MRCSIRIVLLSVMLMVSLSMSFAQGRPPCEFDEEGNIKLPDGVCFLNDNGGIALAGGVDPDGDAHGILWESNDFFQVRADGTLLGTGTSTNATLVVCPATAGGLTCLLDYVFGGMRGPGLLLGTAQFSLVGVYDLNFVAGCPGNSHVNGVVYDLAGQAYDVFFMKVRVKDPETGGCKIIGDDLVISLAK